MQSRILGLVALALTAAGSSAVGQAGLQTIPNPFQMDRSSVVPASSTLRPVQLDAAAYPAYKTAFDREQGIRIDEFALPDRSVELRMRPVRVMPKGSTARVMTESGETALAPSVAMFQGYVPDTASTAFLAISATQFHGYIQIDGELFILSSGRTANGRGMVAHASQFGDRLTASGFCNAIKTALSTDLTGGSGEYSRVLASVESADLFVELDDQYRTQFSTDQDAIDYGALLMTATNEIYRRDFGILMTVPNGYLRLWTTTPPWGVITTFNDIYNVQGWWDSAANPNQNLPRAAVHVFSYPVFGGVAFYPAVCNDQYSYAVSTVYGSFPYPVEHTSNDNWDLLVVSHEYGHVFGSPHTFDYNPPISCTDGSGPDNGTLMGYCHQNPGGVSNVGMRFHSRVQSMIRAHVSTVNCLTSVPFTLGDYDLSGTLDGLDLTALDACLDQGFFSSGCMDAFDMNADGQLDRCDYALLDAAIQGTSVGLYVASLTPNVGDTVTLGICGGQPGTLARFATLQVGGIPFFQFIAKQTLDGNGNASLSGSVPSGLAGLNVQFIGVSFDLSANLTLTNIASMNVQ